jgi:hypothetical protein
VLYGEEWPGILSERYVEGGPGQIVERPLLDISDDADDFERGTRAAGIPDLLAYRVTATKELVCHRFVHDGDVHLQTVIVSEHAPAQHLRTHCRKVCRRDLAPCRLVVLAGSQRLPFHDEVAEGSVPCQRKKAGNRRRAHSRQVLHPAQYFFLKRDCLLIRVICRRRPCHAEHCQVIRPYPDLNMEQPIQTSRE